MKRVRVQSPDNVMPVEQVDDPTGPLVRYEEAAAAIVTAREQEKDGNRRLGESISGMIQAARKLLDDTDAEGRSYHVDRQALEAAIAGAEVDVADVLGDVGAESIDLRRRRDPQATDGGLTAVEHVEAVALINGILDHAPSLPPEIRAGVEGWLAEHRPPPAAYMAAARTLAGGS
jgi:hypothetical protein